MGLDQIEFFAPLNLLATFLFSGLAVWQASDRQWSPAGLFAVFAELSALITMAGFARRRHRDANEDPWQPV